MERFTAAEDALLVTHGAWESLDLPGLIKQLVVVWVPFAPPDAALEATLARELAARGGAAQAGAGHRARSAGRTTRRQ